MSPSQKKRIFHPNQAWHQNFGKYLTNKLFFLHEERTRFQETVEAMKASWKEEQKQMNKEKAKIIKQKEQLEIGNK